MTEQVTTPAVVAHHEAAHAVVMLRACPSLQRGPVSVAATDDYRGVAARLEEVEPESDTEVEGYIVMAYAACRIRHRGIYALKDTFVTWTLAMAEESGEVERLTAWCVRQTGVRLDTLKKHYERWWPRDREAIRATYALLDPSLEEGHCHPLSPKAAKYAAYTAKRKWTMSPSRTT